MKRTDTLVRIKTRLLTQADTTYQTIRDTVLRDIHDTVVVEKFVLACDSLRKSCDAYRAAAEAKFSADSLLFNAQANEIAVWRASRPSNLRVITTDVVLAAAGYGACKAGISPSLFPMTNDD